MIDSALLESLINELSEPQVQSRREAAEKIFHLGAEAVAAVPMLIRALEDGDYLVRYHAATALGRFGPDAHEAVQPLTRMLLDPAETVTNRGQAATVLGLIGPTAEPVLIESLSNLDPLIKRRAASALHKGNFDRTAAIPGLIALLKDEDGDVRSVASEILFLLGSVAEPFLEQSLRSDDAFERCYSAEVMLRRNPAHQRAIMTLIKHLNHNSATVRQDAAWFLRKAGEFGRPAVGPLTRALDDENAAVRRSAASSLGDIGIVAEAAEPALVNALRHGDPELCWAAAYALGKIKAESQAAIQALSDAVKHESEDVRIFAIQALGEIGSKSAIPSLKKALNRPGESDDIRDRIIEALRTIEGEAPSASD